MSTATATETTERVVPRLKARYDETLRGEVQRELGLRNVMEVPRLEKIVVNIGVGDAVAQPSLLEGAVRDLGVITGQRAVVTRARKSIAGFKLREKRIAVVRMIQRIANGCFAIR